MKDAIHHRKHTQKKIIQSARKEQSILLRTNHLPEDKTPNNVSFEKK